METQLFVLCPLNPPFKLSSEESAWPFLKTKGFHEDLAARGDLIKLHAERGGYYDAIKPAVEVIGRSFEYAFNPDKFNVGNDVLKQNFLRAITKLAEEFGTRIPTIVWDTLAFLGTRDEPTKEVTIISQKHHLETLKIHWADADAVLHALGKVYGLKTHIDSRIYEETGTILEHSCDCNSHLYALNANSCVRAFLKPDRFNLMTAAFLTHLLSEVVLIRHLKLPFELGLTPDLEHLTQNA